MSSKPISGHEVSVVAYNQHSKKKKEKKDIEISVLHAVQVLSQGALASAVCVSVKSRMNFYVRHSAKILSGTLKHLLVVSSRVKYMYRINIAYCLQ